MKWFGPVAVLAGALGVAYWWFFVREKPAAPEPEAPDDARGVEHEAPERGPETGDQLRLPGTGGRLSGRNALAALGGHV